jgi:hypothetical protein
MREISMTGRHVLLFLSLLTSCDTASPGPAARGTWLPSAKADGTSQSCVSSCGDQAPAGCWCDDLCDGYGDCCPDKRSVCDGCQPTTCQAGQCGKADDGCGGSLDCGPCAPPLPSCDGAPRFPLTDNLSFSHGTRDSFTRNCDAFGQCSAWQPSGEVVLPVNFSANSTLSPSGEVRLNQLVWRSDLEQDGSSQYRCNYDEWSLLDGTRRDILIGDRVPLDQKSGVAQAFLESGYECNIAGGTGGPDGHDTPRPVSLKLGATCLAITDADPSPRAGKQEKIIYLLWW